MYESKLCTKLIFSYSIFAYQLDIFHIYTTIAYEKGAYVTRFDGFNLFYLYLYISFIYTNFFFMNIHFHLYISMISRSDIYHYKFNCICIKNFQNFVNIGNVLSFTSEMFLKYFHVTLKHFPKRFRNVSQNFVYIGNVLSFYIRNVSDTFQNFRKSFTGSMETFVKILFILKTFHRLCQKRFMLSVNFQKFSDIFNFYSNGNKVPLSIDRLSSRKYL